VRNVPNGRNGELPRAASPTGRVTTSGRLTESGPGDVLWYESGLHRVHQVTLTRDLLSPANTLLLDCIDDRRALVVVSPSVWRLYGRRIEEYFTAQPGSSAVEFMVLDRSESSKSLDGAVEVCERAAAAGLRRTSPIVAIGGGVCSDICGLAAALHHRGIPHIKVPTTLVGLIDAGIGTKNAVNHAGRKSALGSFHPPEHSLLDTDFLASLPRRHLANGLAEIIKLAVVSDAALFALLTEAATALMESGFQAPAPAMARMIRLSVAGMLAELAKNPFETSADFRRRVDFGHTFSPHIEVASDHAILHGEAVAMDIALSTQVACELGVLAEEDLERILSLIQEVGLALAWPRLSVEALWATLPDVVEHRNGDLHLVVPCAIGDCEYLGLDALSPALLQRCQELLLRRCAELRPADSRSGIRV
jgi:2-epi-5-epi-valiolone synthase